MACYNPLIAYQAKSGDIVFNELKRHDIQKQLLLPCGQCVGCRLERSRQWAARCMHHAQMHDKNAFITLTYNDENLQTQSLCHRDYQLFIKRLRKNTKAEISYYMAGEYGTKNRRPHFHACIFGYDFPDKKYWKTTDTNSRLYTSDQLNELWQHQGFTSIGDVTLESAGYIARYILSKKTGKNAQQYYEHINEATGEITNLKPEYNRMSLKRPIGKTWIEKYEKDIYPRGVMILKNQKTKPTKYYDKQYKKKDREKYEQMKQEREIQALQYRKDNTPQRLQAKERVKTAQLNQLLRKI